MNIYKIEKEYLIRTYECDRNENLRLLTLMNIFQDVADSHASAMGLGLEYCLSKGFAWVGSNYHLQIARLPKMHEKTQSAILAGRRKNSAPFANFWYSRKTAIRSLRPQASGF